MEGGQVRFGGESPIGMAFMTFLPSCKTVGLLCEPKDVECWANLAMNGGVRNPPLKTPFSHQWRCGFQPDHPGIRKTVLAIIPWRQVPICTQYITPTIENAGWHHRLQVRQEVILRIDPINRLGTPVEIVRSFGGRDAYLDAVRGLEDVLYEAS